MNLQFTILRKHNFLYFQQWELSILFVIHICLYSPKRGEIHRLTSHHSLLKVQDFHPFPPSLNVAAQGLTGHE